MAKDGSGLAAPDWQARRSSVNAGAPLRLSPQAATERVLGIQRKLHKWASENQERGFSDLHNLICDPATLLVAWRRVRGNRGSRSAGIDGQTAYEIEVRQGVGRFLGELHQELRAGTFRPLAVKERAIPKRSGKLRYLGIPTVRDRVVQAALKLVLEPIFEVDFQPCSYPEQFEYMVSETHRAKLIDAFRSAPGVAAAENVDRKIERIRELASAGGDPALDLYEDPFYGTWKGEAPGRWAEAVHWAQRLFEWDAFDATE